LASSQDKVTPFALVVSSQGKVTAPSVLAASQERVTPPPTDDPPKPDHALDIDQAPIDSFLADLEADDAHCYVPDQGCGPLKKKKLMFSSQEMPKEEAFAFTTPLTAKITPRTLHALASEIAIQKCTPQCNKRRGSGRKKR
jgi:hypothetical protein